MNIIEKAREFRKLIKEYAENSEDKTLVIATSNYFKEWTPDKYMVGDIRTKNGKPYECMEEHDSTVNTDWTIDVRTVWKPYHSKKKEFALPWEKPTGSHDMYKVWEYMIFDDGYTYKCLQDTVYSPIEYSQSWEKIN